MRWRATSTTIVQQRMVYMADETVLQVEGLTKYFPTAAGLLHAVDGLDFSVPRGKTLGLVGESGCGKSTTGRVILKLLKPTSGRIIFQGEDITNYSARRMRPLRCQMQMIFQDPFSSLDPRQSVMQLISEPIIQHRLLKSKRDIEHRTLELMDTVGLASRYINTYPHELDGGRRQRIGIARALAVDPKLIVCDEPVSALDVSIQAQILNLLKQLQREYGLTYLFITHNLAVVRYFSDEIAVMYLGKIVEQAPAERLFSKPMHPYTKALFDAVPQPIVGEGRVERQLIRGEITSAVNLPDECRFCSRCDYVMDACRQKDPPLIEIAPGHRVACARVRSMGDFTIEKTR